MAGTKSQIILGGAVVGKRGEAGIRLLANNSGTTVQTPSLPFLCGTGGFLPGMFTTQFTLSLE